MSPEEQKIWNDSTTLLKSIDSIGIAKLQKKLDGLTSEQDKTKLVGYMKSWVEALPSAKVADWRIAAQAWVMLKVSTVCIGFGSLTDAMPNEKTEFLSALAGADTAGLRSKLASEMSGKGILDVIAKAQISDQRNQWDLGAFTSPAGHNPASFRYIIHAMVPAIGYADSEKVAYAQSKGRGGFISDGVLRIAELYFSQPAILQSEVMCCSVIDQDKTSTYRGATFGFILKVPRQNLVAAFSSDAETSSIIGRARGDALSQIKSQQGKAVLIEEFLDGIAGLYSQKLPTPDDILAASKKGEGHNELVVMGATPGFFSVPSGIFVKTTAAGKLPKEFIEVDTKWGLKKLMKTCAVNLSIPIVNIPDKKVEASTVDFSAWKP